MLSAPNQRFYIYFSLGQGDLPSLDQVKKKNELLQAIQMKFPHLLHREACLLNDTRFNWLKRIRHSEDYPFKNGQQAATKKGVVWNDYYLELWPLLLAMVSNMPSVHLSGIMNSLLQKNEQCLISVEAESDKVFTRTSFLYVENQLWKVIPKGKCYYFQTLTGAGDNSDEAIKTLEAYNVRVIETAESEGFYTLNWDRLVEYLENIEPHQERIDVFKRTETLDQWYDEISITRIQSRTYHLLYSWLGEDLRQTGYEAFDHFMQKRDGALAWEKAIDSLLMAKRNIPEDVSDILKKRYLLPLLCTH